MDEMNDDNQKKMEASEDSPTDSTGGGGSSRPEEDEPPSEEALAAAAQSLRPVSQASGSTAPADPSPETKEDAEHLTKAKLLEYGRKFAKMRKDNRLKARARAEQEKAKGLLTMTLKGHKDHRRLVMVFGKKLIITLDHMREANLNAGLLEDGLTKFLEDYYKTHVGPHVKKKR